MLPQAPPPPTPPPPPRCLAPRRSRAGGVRGGAPRLAGALPLPAGEGPALPQLEREPLSQRQPGKAVLSGGLAGNATTTNRVGPGSEEQRDRLSGKPGEPADGSGNEAATEGRRSSSGFYGKPTH